MTIQYCSDLHLEFKENKDYLRAHPLQPAGEVLLLAGDITPFTLLDQQQDFFSYVSDHFATVYWLPGNHEYYHADLADYTGILNEKIRENVFLVNNIAINLEHIKLVFSTMWTHINPINAWHIQRGMNDFRIIKNNKTRFTVEEFNQLHQESMAFLTSELENTNATSTIVITHHVPTFQHYPPQYKADILSEAFAVELTPFIETTAPDYWIFGHHHSNIPEFIIGHTRMLTNQLGYVKYGEHQSFDPAKVIK